jgi:hypothetical protein
VTPYSIRQHNGCGRLLLHSAFVLSRHLCEVAPLASSGYDKESQNAQRRIDINWCRSAKSTPRPLPRKHLGAVVLGAYTNGKLRHYGYAGSGFSEKGLKDAVDRMEPLLTDNCPSVNPPNINEKIQWVRPKLVCEIEYAELTVDEQLRQTTFLGWRDDKRPEDIVLELH